MDEILDDGTCTVTFKEYDHTEITQVMYFDYILVSVENVVKF